MNVKFPLKEIVKLFENPEISGDDSVELSAIASLTKATPTDLSFLGNKKYSPEVPETKAGAVLLPRNYKGELPQNSTIVRVDDPSRELAKLGEIIEKALWPKPVASIHPTAVIDPKAKVGENVVIGANVIISEGAEIGDGTVLQGNNYVGRFAKLGADCFIFPNAVIMDYCELGNRVRLQPGAVIGSDGYGYVFVDGKHVKVPQVGKVVLEDDVEIGANTTIDRARFDTTRVGAGSKVDNLVQIAHNVQVGKGALLVSQVGISGSTEIGDYAVLGGQVGVAGHLKIGAGAMIGGQSGINGDIEPKAYMRGTPPRPYMKAHKIDVMIGHLPELFDRVKDVEQKLGIEKKTFGKQAK
ncbi:MAG: UDP-3-O-(3-hydroxymyristoyl)glucosamine N-acyltransferase [Opitutales bacterium]|nr:UDP-3-O-(3-hydroxymyristoyl)glucosamine N-acyltransferase [Opitutales bacterium]MBP3357863.1 UDP-3-O-(3-hydroxymyristoyl)glucosamine N-acyltransferase [Opitutales bacterium]MBR7105836.1 UDP-3-O-(3-hydroxymyristoyl)glucosamine N-acyltransferase [Opitutales bacterium]